MYSKSTNKEKYCIIIQNLTKSYHGKPILKNISFSVKKGTIHGFIGPNGAGKSTTLRALMRLVIPQKGKIYIEGQENKSMLNIGYARAEPKFPDYRVEQIVVDCATFLNLSLKNKKQQISLSWAKQQLTNSPLNKYRQQKFSSLSTGWKKTLQLFILTLYKPKILILDEPFNGLDATFHTQLIESLKEARQKGCSILLSTHTLSDLQELADDITIIKQGQVVYTGSKNIDIQKTYKELFLQKRENCLSFI